MSFTQYNFFLFLLLEWIDGGGFSIVVYAMMAYQNDSAVIVIIMHALPFNHSAWCPDPTRPACVCCVRAESRWMEDIHIYYHLSCVTNPGDWLSGSSTTNRRPKTFKLLIDSSHYRFCNINSIYMKCLGDVTMLRRWWCAKKKMRRKFVSEDH